MKKCPYCAELIQDDAVKCRYCGEFLPKPEKKPPAKVGQTKKPPVYGLAIAGFILALVFAPVGLILSVIALVRIRGKGDTVRGRGMAIGGIIAGIVLTLVALVVPGAGLLSRMFGDEEALRGDSLAGEVCESTQDCQAGSICFAYGDDVRRCLQTCSGDKTCEGRYTCVSTSERSGRKSTRVRAVCVEDEKVRPEDR